MKIVTQERCTLSYGAVEKAHQTDYGDGNPVHGYSSDWIGKRGN